MPTSLKLGQLWEVASSRKEPSLAANADLLQLAATTDHEQLGELRDVANGRCRCRPLVIGAIYPLPPSSLSTPSHLM